LRPGLPLVILGITFKENTNLTAGSPALLLRAVLEERGEAVEAYDPHVHGPRADLRPAVYLVGARHREFADYVFPRGSVVLDPWRYIADQEGVEVIRIGQAREGAGAATRNGRPARQLASNARKAV
jgi:UDPglucose 6-dehydrogenase